MSEILSDYVARDDEPVVGAGPEPCFVSGGRHADDRRDTACLEVALRKFSHAAPHARPLEPRRYPRPEPHRVAVRQLRDRHPGAEADQLAAVGLGHDDLLPRGEGVQHPGDNVALDRLLSMLDVLRVEEPDHLPQRRPVLFGGYPDHHVRV